MRFLILAMTLGAAALFAALTPARAASPCGAGYGDPLHLDLAALLQKGGPAADQVSHVWGRGTMQPKPEGDGSGLLVRYPQGSVDPADKAAPQGGGGFLYRAPGQAQARCLAYRVRFSDGFDFARGGKLPGLYGGAAPRGCVAADLAAGFSARLMWRAGGAGELYLYAPDRTAHCGESIGRGSFHFTPGRWTRIAEEVVLNQPGQSDGVVRVWADGRLAVERRGLDLREQPQIGVDGLIFSTFFGGHGPDWASPRDQSAEFADFTIWTARPGP